MLKIFVIPKHIISDRGKAFDNKIFAEFCWLAPNINWTLRHFSAAMAKTKSIGGVGAQWDKGYWCTNHIYYWIKCTGCNLTHPVYEYWPHSNLSIGWFDRRMNNTQSMKKQTFYLNINVTLGLLNFVFPSNCGDDNDDDHQNVVMSERVHFAFYQLIVFTRFGEDNSTFN